MNSFFVCFFFQAEDGIRDLVRSRGLGDVYKRQLRRSALSRCHARTSGASRPGPLGVRNYSRISPALWRCLLYTSDAADERSSVDLGGRRIINKKKKKKKKKKITTSVALHRCAISPR